MNKSISKNAIFKAILNLSNIILPIVVTPFVTNTFSSTNYMSYLTQAETYNTILIALASFGIYQYGLREISKVRNDKIKLSQIFTNLFFITAASTTLVSIGYVLFLYKFCRDDPAFFTCLILAFNIIFNIFYVEWVNEALENYDFITIKTMILKISYSLAVLIFIRKADDFHIYLYLGLAVNILNNLISYFYIKKRIKFDFSHMEIKKYIKPMFLVVILSNSGLLYTQLDRFMIEMYSSATDLTCYGAIAQKSILIINTLLLTIIQVTMPRLSNNLGNNKSDSYYYLLNKSMKIYFLILFPSSIGLFCISKQIMWIFSYSDSAYVPWTPLMKAFSIYMLTVGIQGIISNQIIYLHGKEKADIKIFFIGGICNLILNFSLLYAGIFNGTNAIITTMISNIVVICLEYAFVKKYISSSINIFSISNLKYFYYSLIFIPITLIINIFVNDMILSCTLDILICILIYIGILIITKDETLLYIFNKFYTKLKNKYYYK